MVIFTLGDRLYSNYNGQKSPWRFIRCVMKDFMNVSIFLIKMHLYLILLWNESKCFSYMIGIKMAISDNCHFRTFCLSAFFLVSNSTCSQCPMFLNFFCRIFRCQFFLKILKGLPSMLNCLLNAFLDLI